MIDFLADKGPINILCKEIGFRFNGAMETPELLIAFVSVLVDYVAQEREMSAQISRVIGLDAAGNPTTAPSEDSGFALRRVQEMLALTDVDEMIAAAARCHHFFDEVNPDDAYPTDHCIDQLSSCVSAIRFGLEKPCHSRHAAEASNHVWKQRYGVRLFDQYTSDWQKDWARQQLHEAIVKDAVRRERERCLAVPV